jgi:hypothetical protein
MKKVLLICSFFFSLGLVAVNAQSCAGHGSSCCASKISKAVSSDPTIEKRMADDGTVSYVRKEADTQGNVKFVSVKYDEASNAFVNVAPKTISPADKASCTKKAACCAGGAKSGKACCAAEATAQ